MACDPATTVTEADMIGLNQDIATIDEVVESSLDTATTKSGKVINTLLGQLKLLGYIPPVVYAGSILFEVGDNTQTIDRSGVIYAPLPSELPFTTTGTWVADDEDKFFVVQGLVAGDSSEFITYEAGNNFTGGVDRTQEDKNAEAVSVKDFGAVGDGVTDDTAAIQAAIDSHTNGYEVDFPTSSGSYNFTEVIIEDKADLSFTGAGIIDGQFTIENSLVDNDIQSNIQFNGLNFNRGRPDVASTAIKLVFVSGVKIRGCTFRGVQKCIELEGLAGKTQSVQRVLITDCTTGFADASLYSAAEKASPYVYQTTGFPYYFYYNDSPGGVFSGGDFTVTGCNPVFCSVTHIWCQGQDGIVLTGNTFFHTSYSYQSPIKENVVYAEDSVFLNITNNEIFEAGYEGICLNKVSNATVAANNIIWPGQRDVNRGYGITIATLGVTDPVTASQITGNLIRQPTNSGINVQADCEFVSAVGNKIITPGNLTTFYYGTTPGVTAFGIESHPSGWQNSFSNNVTMNGYYNIAPSTSTKYGSVELSGPFQANNVDTAGISHNYDVLKQTVFPTGGTSPLLVDGFKWITTERFGACTPTAISGGVSGQTLTIEATIDTITINPTANIKIGTLGSLVITSGGTATFMLSGSVWKLIGTAL